MSCQLTQLPLMPHDGEVRFEWVLVAGQNLAQQEDGGQVIALVPVVGSLLNRHVAPQLLYHDSLVAENHIIEAARVMQGYLDAQQILDTLHKPAGRDADDSLEGITSRVEQGETEL